MKNQNKKSVTHRLSETARNILIETAEENSISFTAALELLIRSGNKKRISEKVNN